MTDDETAKPMALSREDLYELAWSKPISQLAADFGISDVALAKRCRRLGIPLPGRGYWARVDAGQRPYRPRLPKRDPQWQDQNALAVAPSVGAFRGTTLSTERAHEMLTSAAPESTPARIAAVSAVRATSLFEALPAVKRTARNAKHPRRSELTFEHGERGGPICALDVTAEVLDRALLLSDTFLRAAAELGWIFDDPQGLRKKQGKPIVDIPMCSSPENPKETPEPSVGRLLVEGEQVALRIEERLREESVEPTAAQLARERREYGYRAPRKVSVPTGALRLVRLDTYRTYGEPDRRSWYDRKGKLVEEQIPEVLLGFYELALSIKERREKDEREACEREEHERRRKELEAIRDANQKLITQLEADAGAWHRARYLRRYIKAARSALAEQALPARFRDDTVDYLDWAEHYVNELDPLARVIRSGEFEESSTYHFQNDLDRMKKAFGRLLGAEWSKAFKLGHDYARDPNSGRHRSYGEKSIFEVGSAEEADDQD
jgi:hypothetical protein